MKPNMSELLFSNFLTMFLSLSCCSRLVNVGVLTVRDVGTWWMAIPAAGVFMKSFSQGPIILTTINLLQSNLY